MNTKNRESIYAFLRRHGVLERVLGKESRGGERQLPHEHYPSRLILESDRLLYEPTDREEFFSLRRAAERAFASQHSWAHGLHPSAEGVAAEWERQRAERLGECFMWHFADIYEGLPLYVRDGDGFRVATAQDDAYACVIEMLEGAWSEFTVNDDPPAWAESLFIKRSELSLHQQFFGDYGSFQDQARTNAARELRKAAFRRALALQQSQSQQKILGRHLQALIEALPKVRDILSLSGDQAILYTEDAFRRLPLTLYLEHNNSGFWAPCASDDQVTQVFAGLKASDYAMGFHNGDLRPRDAEKWTDLRLAPLDFDALLEDARCFAGPNLAGAAATKAPEHEAPTAQCLNPNHLNYSPKLAAAIAAWKALTADPSLAGKRHPKTAAAAWLGEHASRLGLLKTDGTPNAQGIEEISKVVNWKPEGGAPKSGA
jgi:hypothetical protein